MSIAPVENKMEAKSSKHAEEKEIHDETDDVTNIVTNVIHEYDVIDDPPNDCQSTSTATNQIDEKDDNLINAPRNNLENEQNIGEQMVSSSSVSNRHRLSSSDRSNSIAETESTRPRCPAVNCKEKIVICMDISAEMEKQSFRSRAGDRLSPKEMLNKALKLFLHNKSRLDKKHEFALILLQETAVWAQDFSNNPRDILTALEDVVDTNVCDTCDISSLFDKISEKVDMPVVDGDVSSLPPHHVVRVVLIYGRNNCPLQFQKEDSFKLLTASPYFFIDALYIHDQQSEENKCQEVFDSICDLDTTGLSYIHGVSRNPTKVYDYMAQLLAHPLQRPLQEETAYRIGSSIPTPENG